MSKVEVHQSSTAEFSDPGLSSLGQTVHRPIECPVCEQYTLLKMGRYYNTTMCHYWDILVK